MATWEAKNDPGLEANWSDIPEAVHTKVETLSNLVLTSVRALVEREEAVRVTVAANHRRVMFTVRVHRDDVGLAVGSHGRHADALRTLLVAACRKLRFHFDMDIGGPDGDPDWSSDK